MWLSLVTQFPLAQLNATREDYDIFAWLVSRTFLSWNEGWKLQSRTSAIATVCEKAITFLHSAAERGWRNGGSYSALDWFVMLGERSLDGDTTQEEPFPQILYRHAPYQLTSLLCALYKHRLLIDDAGDHLHYILGTILSPGWSAQRSPITPSELLPRWSLTDNETVTLVEWTSLMRRFRSAGATSGPLWPRCFVWAANEWLLSLERYLVVLPLSRQSQDWMADSFTEVLKGMATGLDAATKQHWSNGGFKDEELPWLSSIFRVQAHPGRTKLPAVVTAFLSRPPRTYAPIVLLEWFAPAALRLFASIVTRAVDSGNISGSSIREDVLLLHSYLNATPRNRKTMVQHRQLGHGQAEPGEQPRQTIKPASGEQPPRLRKPYTPPLVTEAQREMRSSGEERLVPAAMRNAQAPSSLSEADNLSLLRALPCFMEPLANVSEPPALS